MWEWGTGFFIYGIGQSLPNELAFRVEELSLNSFSLHGIIARIIPILLDVGPLSYIVGMQRGVESPQWCGYEKLFYIVLGNPHPMS